MKYTILAAVALMAASTAMTTAAEAQGRFRDSRCQERRETLIRAERRAARDGRISFWERRQLNSLRRDVARACSRR